MLQYDGYVRIVAAIALLVAACASAPEPRRATYYPPPIQTPFLWRVTSPQGSIVLFATHQGAAAADVSPMAWAELEHADVFVAEADEMPTATGVRDRDEWNEMFYLPRGSSLMKLLGDDDYMELRSRIDGPVNNYKPWVALMKLAAAAYPPPSDDINTALVERARKRGIPAEFLETWRDQAQYLDAAITPAALTSAIHDYPRIACTITSRLTAFRAGDDAVFANEIASETQPIVPRIARWSVRLDEYLASGRHAFVAIGIGQIVGPYGLLAKFSERGYQVQRL